MGKKYYLAHVRGGTLLRGQEQAVRCGESKQEPSKAGLLPTAEIAVPLTGKSACRGPCPSPPFLCRQSSHHCPFSPAKLCLCSLGSRSRWAGYCFPDFISPLLLYLLCLLVHLDLSWLSWESWRTFWSQLWGNFLAVRGIMRRALKDYQHLRYLTGSFRQWRHGSWASILACCFWKKDISLPAPFSPILCFPPHLLQCTWTLPFFCTSSSSRQSLWQGHVLLVVWTLFLYLI